MESGADKRQKISRKNFLRICGSVLAGGSIAGVSGVLFYPRMDTSKGNNKSNAVVRDRFSSPYKLVSSFKVPAFIQAFELAGSQIIVAASDTIFIYDTTGSLTGNFAIGNTIRDIAADNNNIYLLFPTRIEVYDLNGKWQRNWEACSDQSDYCSMAVTPEALFVTDAANKNICKYTTDGRFVRFIQSPDSFIIPSYSFGITYADGIIYCSNPGRHRVEKYTPDGDYIGHFGQAGGTAGMFCGCCNPVHLAYTSTGDIITSEKGNPRVSCYSTEGEFRSLLLDSKALGGGHTAYDIKIHEDRIFIAGEDIISTFRYDRKLAAKTACSGCEVDCPLRKGVSI